MGNTQAHDSETIGFAEPASGQGRQRGQTITETARILGIDFFQGSAEEAVSRALGGGLIVAPSGPNLAEIDRMPEYRTAVTSADLAILDSGFLVLCWRWKTGQSLERLSGLEFLQALLDNERFAQIATEHLWVMPSKAASDRNRLYLKSRGIHLSDEQCTVAPFYDSAAIRDPQLLERIQRRRPRLIAINIAGGKQEILGHWLREHLDYDPTIICTGAAIAFLTGEQAQVPRWADRLFLGWLMRILRNPRLYAERYWKARRLWALVAQ